MYTPAQASEMLQIATSTLRKYSRIFVQHLSQQTNRQHRRYTENDIATLKKIIALRQQGVALEEINRQLALQPATPDHDTIQPHPNLPSIYLSALAPMDIQPLIEMQSEQMSALAEQYRQEYRELDEIVSNLQDEVQRLRREIELIKEERVLEQTQLKQDIQAELSHILAEIETAKENLIQNQMTTSAESLPPRSDDTQTELMQIRAEIYRLKESQKRTEQKLKALAERMDTPFWRRGPKNPLEI